LYNWLERQETAEKKRAAKHMKTHDFSEMIRNHIEVDGEPRSMDGENQEAKEVQKTKSILEWVKSGSYTAPNTSIL
jgi:hypothetical protein